MTGMSEFKVGESVVLIWEPCGSMNRGKVVEITKKGLVLWIDSEGEEFEYEWSKTAGKFFEINNSQDPLSIRVVETKTGFSKDEEVLVSFLDTSEGGSPAGWTGGGCDEDHRGTVISLENGEIRILLESEVVPVRFVLRGKVWAEKGSILHRVAVLSGIRA